MTTSILNRMKSSAIDLVAASLIAALAVVAPVSLTAQQNAAPQKAAVKPALQAEEESEAPAAQKPGVEGIKVHGHWVIDVKEKDGRLVEHRDFQNALQVDGASALIGFLIGAASAESMVVGLASTGTSYGIYSSGSSFSTGATCSNYFPTGCFATLTRTYGTTNGRASSIILSGSVPGQSTAYTVSGVTTLVNFCGTSSGSAATAVAPTACTSNVASTNPGNSFYTSQFTGTTITALAVAAGQVLSVTVTLSFS